MMYNNYFDTGRHMSGINGGFGGGFDSLSFGPEVLFGLSVLGFILAVLFILSIVLKGYALWVAAKRNEKWWFIALLVINTMGVLELLYLLFIAKASFGLKRKCCDRCEHCDNCNHHNSCEHSEHCGHCDSCKKNSNNCEVEEVEEEDISEDEDDMEKMSAENKKNTDAEIEGVL